MRASLHESPATPIEPLGETRVDGESRLGKLNCGRKGIGEGHGSMVR